MKQRLIGIASGLVVGLVGLALLLVGPLSPNRSSAPAPSQSATPTQTAQPTQSEPVSSAPEVEPCLVTDLENDPLILQLQAQVRDASTSAIIFDRSGAIAARPASVQKLLTAAAALKTLGANYTATTRVFQDQTNKSVIYLVGGGDPTLTRLSEGVQSVYKNAPKLDVLAAQAIRSLGGVSVSKIVVDSSLFGGPSGEYLSVWDKRGLSEGYQPYISALQVDGDRDNPAKLSSKRSTDPVKRAGDWFKRSLGQSAKSALVEKGTTPPTAKEIAKISSRPIVEWIDYMLEVSDNTTAEALARLVSLDVGLGGGSGTLTQAFQQALAGTGLNLTGIKIEDGSGLSKYNQVSPALMNDLLTLIPKDPELNVMLTGFPVAGSPGSLSDRFNDYTGDIVAKTGWIRTGYTLAGYLNLKDGGQLIFTAYNLGDSVNLDHRAALDRLVEGFYNCGTALRDR
ncbi:MAG: D-alanyl-D-alanine carboxypeptidase [Actinobacteria bacterium]|nr:D-alanyl-D-alanine carboxypeptidase [Actinomycetota bacterium]